MKENPPRTLTVDGVTLTLRVERKAVKHINARLRETTLHVSLPLRAPLTVLDTVLPDLARQLVRRQRSRQINSAEAALDLARRVARRFPQPPAVDAVQFSTGQSARWGSYSLRTRGIRLHAALRLMPPWVLEAVVVHELAHAIHPDHSPAFWALLRQVCPDTDRATAFLEGVSWLARSWETLPPVERAQLARPFEEEPGE